jgi:hypothetical protein
MDTIKLESGWMIAHAISTTNRETREMIDSCYSRRMTTEARFFTQYADGTFAVCTATDVDEALDILARSSEMLHGPIEGEVPADVDPKLIDDLG